MLKIAICDDESQFRIKIKELLAEYEKNRCIEIQIYEFEDGAALFQENLDSFDILLLDIKMRNLNGIEVAKRIRRNHCNINIVFVTSLIQYALEGYKINAVDYLLKPISYKSLEDVIDRACKKMDVHDFILIKNDSGIYKVSVIDIVYIETYSRNIRIHMVHGDSIISYMKMKEIEKLLPKTAFYRCHTAYIVNLKYVKKLEKNDICLSTDDIIPLSRSQKESFKIQLLEYWGDKL